MKDKIKEIISEQESIQKWFKENRGHKDPNIQHNIAFGYAVLDYLYHRECINHKARLKTHFSFSESGIPITYRCIEDINNRSVQRFVNRVRGLAFKNYDEWVGFTTHPSRRKIG